jgi:hypothetical protein
MEEIRIPDKHTDVDLSKHLTAEARIRRNYFPHKGSVKTIYAPMIYTAPCIMFWMRAFTRASGW